MILQQPASRCRRAFSLIELLVAIAIIAILVALTLAFIIPMLREGPKMSARSDLSKFNESMQQFQEAYGVNSPPPSPLRLCPKPTQYSTSAVDLASLQYLNSLFPRLNWSAANPIDWSGGMTPGFTSSSGVLLDGDQVLVFFLGGIPTAQGPKGFSNYVPNPTNFAMGTAVKGPFFNFQTGRLFTRSATHHFFSYADPFQAGPYATASSPTGSPYLYFSAGRLPNGYNSAYSITLLNGTVTAYYQQNSSPNQYFNPKSFQVISAGQDGLFGPGGFWNQAAPAPSSHGVDDMTNFYGAVMGAGGG